MIYLNISGVPYVSGDPTAVAEYALNCVEAGHPVAWWTDNPNHDRALTILMCAEWGVPFRTESEMDAVAYGSSEDRPVPAFGIDPAPRDYLD